MADVFDFSYGTLEDILDNDNSEVKSTKERKMCKMWDHFKLRTSRQILWS